ncbi:flagellin, partial [Verrucomicrobia bacterium]|nr:flagellin [Verrucomicrobiota bacterium]
ALFEKEFDTLQAHITDLSASKFNGVALFSATALKVTKDSDGGTFDAAGINIGHADDKIAKAAVTGITIAELGVPFDASTDPDTAATKAHAALDAVTLAITSLAEHRATVGASMSRMENTSSNLSVLKDNIGAANSRIKDVDVAEESANFARQNILVQSGTAMLAQANALPQSALRLIG